MINDFLSQLSFSKRTLIYVTQITPQEAVFLLKKLSMAYQNLYFMVIKSINSNELLENLILVIDSKR